MVEYVQNNILSTILKHDSNVTSYKIALLRSINDVVLSYPSLMKYRNDIAVPLRKLAEYWIAYYWPFVDAPGPIYQGQQMKNKNDVSFRPALEKLRSAWSEIWQGTSPSDGFYLINEMRLKRRSVKYSSDFIQVYNDALDKIARAIENPIRYAGPEQWTVFPKPERLRKMNTEVTAIPGAEPQDKCVILPLGLWNTFHNLSLWVEALNKRQKADGKRQKQVLGARRCAPYIR